MAKQVTLDEIHNMQDKESNNLQDEESNYLQDEEQRDEFQPMDTSDP